MYKCDKCGKVIERLPTVVDYVPYGDTDVPMESTDEDCACGGTYLEAIKCKVCGNIKHVDEGIAYIGEICHDCLEKEANDVKTLRMAYENAEDGDIDELADYILYFVLRAKPSKVIWDYIESECRFSSVRSELEENIHDFLDGRYEDFASRLIERGMVE